jgi:hypothetical protein
MIPRVRTRGTSTLTVASFALLAAMGLHGFDHYRQERGIDALTREVYYGGFFLGALALTALVFNLRGHPRAPMVSAVIGFWITFAVLAAHFAPHWSAFSDPYATAGLDAFSWFAALLEVAVAFVLGVLATRELRGLRVSGATA